MALPPHANSSGPSRLLLPADPLRSSRAGLPLSLVFCRYRLRGVHMKLTLWTLAVCSILLSGCCTPWHGQKTTAAGGETFCAKHQIPLVTVRTYKYPPKPLTFVDPSDDYVRAAECYPNLWPFYASETPRGESTFAIKVSYCPECEHAARRMLR